MMNVSVLDLSTLNLSYKNWGLFSQTNSSENLGFKQFKYN